MDPLPKKIRRRLRLTEEAFAVVKNIKEQANKDFAFGRVSYSDVVNELLLNANVNIKALQKKHTDIRKSLRAMAIQQDIDIEAAIKNLKTLKLGKVTS